MKGYVRVNAVTDVPTLKVYDPEQKEIINVVEVDLVHVTNSPDWIKVNRLVQMSKFARDITEQLLDNVIKGQFENDKKFLVSMDTDCPFEFNPTLNDIIIERVKRTLPNSHCIVTKNGQGQLHVTLACPEFY